MKSGRSKRDRKEVMKRKLIERERESEGRSTRSKEWIAIGTERVMKTLSAEEEAADERQKASIKTRGDRGARERKRGREEERKRGREKTVWVRS
jgi:hypothetical protein